MPSNRERTRVRARARLSFPLFLCAAFLRFLPQRTQSSQRGKILCALFLCCFFLSPLHGDIGYLEPWGNDAGIHLSHAEKVPSPRPPLLTQMADQIIRFHQTVLSPVDGPRSHFRPSSSEYMRQAIHKYGFVKGYLMGCDRLLRENKDPWVYRKIADEGILFKWDPP